MCGVTDTTSGLGLFGALLLLVALSACGDEPLEPRRGALGERCRADQDCRDALFCTRGVCSAPDAQPDQRDDTPRAPFGEGNPTPEPALRCTRLCEHLSDCGAPLAGGNCISDCLSFIDASTSGNSAVACATEASCADLEEGALERCFEAL